MSYSIQVRYRDINIPGMSLLPGETPGHAYFALVNNAGKVINTIGAYNGDTGIPMVNSRLDYNKDYKDDLTNANNNPTLTTVKTGTEEQITALFNKMDEKALTIEQKDWIYGTVSQNSNSFVRTLGKLFNWDDDIDAALAKNPNVLLPGIKEQLQKIADGNSFSDILSDFQSDFLNSQTLSIVTARLIMGEDLDKIAADMATRAVFRAGIKELLEEMNIPASTLQGHIAQGISTYAATTNRMVA